MLLEDDLDSVRVVVETLTDEFELMEVALAAVKLAHEATVAAGGEDEEEIPEVALRTERSEKGRPDGKGKGKGPRTEGRGDRTESAGAHRTTGQDMTRLYVSAGRSARVRPGDLVGAIAGETSLSGRDIGSIEISDGFSLVEVPSAKVDEVIEALRSTTLRGKKVTARRERY